LNRMTGLHDRPDPAGSGGDTRKTAVGPRSDAK
jgi:hypothetical protein